MITVSLHLWSVTTPWIIRPNLDRFIVGNDLLRTVFHVDTHEQATALCAALNAVSRNQEPSR